jgi:DNA mismatch repair protein MutS
MTEQFKKYLELKAKYPGCLLALRIGDAYNFLMEDARVTSAILGLTLSKKDGEPVCGFPYHHLEGYLGKLIKSGQRVAICEGIESATSPALHPGMHTKSICNPAYIPQSK